MVSTSPTPQLAVSKINLAVQFSESSGGELIFALRAELSLWLAAISAFLEPENYSFKEAAAKNFVEQNWTKELRALHFAALRATHLLSRVAARTPTSEFAEAAAEPRELAEFYLMLNRFSIGCGESLSVEKFTYYAWRNLCESWRENLAGCPAFEKAISFGKTGLPASLVNLRQTPKARQIFGNEVLSVIERLNGLLTMLGMIGKKLETDSPLKNSLLFFSLIHSETKNLLKFIEERVLRSMPPDHEFFDLLDGTIYIVSLELRKVYTRELKGVHEIRPAPIVVARTETSHGLLQDCFQQSIILLANAFDPTIEGWRIFPNYQTRLEQSLVLRGDLWRALQNVQRAESAAENYPAEKLKNALETLRQNSLQFLMFKDCEPTERFIEEILQAKRLADITHVLHRFGAYLETLLGQVNMRGVLANHPFDYPKIED